jgi:hypothetical protein
MNADLLPPRPGIQIKVALKAAFIILDNLTALDFIGICGGLTIGSIAWWPAPLGFALSRDCSVS